MMIWQSSHFIANPQIRANSPAHLGTGSMQIGLQLRDRRAGDLRYLLVAALMEHLQGKDHPLVLIQLRERISHNAVELPIQERSIRRQLVVSNLNNAVVIDSNPILITLLRPQRFAGYVLRYAKQP